MKSPYDILGVAPTASADDIRRAYHRLAKTNHPDTNPDKKDAAEKFAAISSAHTVLADPEKRARFDRGEIDATGADIQRPRPGRHGGHQQGGFNPSDIEEMLRQAGGGRRRGDFRTRGEDARYSLAVSFMDAALGIVRRITLPDGRSLDVTIPAGHADGQALRLRGQGQPGFGGGTPGDALIEITVAPHRFFRREENDIILDLPVTLPEAVLGARVEVPTLTGPVTLSIPPRSGPGTRLRLRGRGIGTGHQFVVLTVVLPQEPEPALEEFLKTWPPDHPQNPRETMTP